MSKVKKVTTQVQKYLRHESPERARLRATLEALTGKLPSTAIFGGMLREFALGAARNFTSDIDLVTEATSADIERAIKEFSPTRNKFGGFRFNAGKWRFDIWAFEDTWAFRQGLVKGNELTDLFRTTFFNLDAALYHLGRRRFLFSADYERGVLERVLELNLAANPAPGRMVGRAIRLAVDKELGIGPQLAEFIVIHQSRTAAEGLYGSVLGDLRRHLDSGAETPYRYRPQSAIPLHDR